MDVFQPCALVSVFFNEIFKYLAFVAVMNHTAAKIMPRLLVMMVLVEQSATSYWTLREDVQTLTNPHSSLREKLSWHTGIALRFRFSSFLTSILASFTHEANSGRV